MSTQQHQNKIEHRRVPAAVDPTSSITVPLDLSGSANLIRNLWQKNVQNFVEIGQELSKVKDLVGHGDFLKWVAEQQLFGEDTAERLMKVAANAVLANSAHARNLPASETTLYELARLPETLLEKYIADGTITPRTKRKDVEKLRPKKSKKEPRPLNLKGRRRQAEKRLSALVAAAEAFAKVELDLEVPEYSQRPGWVDLLGSVVLAVERGRDRLEELGDTQEEAKAAAPRPPTFTVDSLPTPDEAAL